MHPFLDVKYSECDGNISDTSINEDDEYDNDIDSDTTEPVTRESNAEVMMMPRYPVEKLFIF